MTEQTFVPVVETPFFQRRWVRITGMIALILALIFCCCIPLAAFTWSQRAVLFAPWQTEAEATNEAPATTVVVAPTDVVSSETCGKSWAGDCFGPELSFPDTATTGIAEIGNPDSGFCALVRVNEGEQLTWNSFGAYWLSTAGQSAVIAQWPHHLKRYQAKPENRDCQVYPSVEEFLLVNPTFR